MKLTSFLLHPTIPLSIFFLLVLFIIITTTAQYTKDDLHSALSHYKYLQIINNNNNKNDNPQTSEEEISFQIGLIHQTLAKMNNDDDKEGDFAKQQHLEKAEIAYRQCLNINPTHTDALNNLGFTLSILRTNDNDNDDRIMELYQRAIASSPNHLQSRINLGLHLHNRNLHKEAIEIFQTGLQYHPTSIPLYYNMAASAMKYGDIQQAVTLFQKVIALDGRHANAWLNLAALHHLYGKLEDAIWHYERSVEVLSELGPRVEEEDGYGLEEFVRRCVDLAGRDSTFRMNDTGHDTSWGVLEEFLMRGSSSLSSSSVSNPNEDGDCTDVEACREMQFLQKLVFHNNDNGIANDIVMLLDNYGQALLQQQQTRDAIGHHLAAASILRARILLLDQRHNDMLLDELLQSLVHSFKTAKAGCLWGVWEEWMERLVSDVDLFQLERGFQPSLLPFDTLSLPVSPLWRKKVAMKHASQYSFDAPTAFHFPATMNCSPNNPSGITPSCPNRKLHIGYLSYDFNDHPTAHLIEGVLFWHNQSSSSVEVAAYSYGKNDDSLYRNSIEQLVGGKHDQGGNFFDFSTYSHDDTIQTIRSDNPHIVFDLQGFTFGSRPELTSRRLAPIQVNYLVFPGTGGAPFVDYLIGDKIVSPPEHASHYTEKLALLPRCYQINHYDRHANPNTTSSSTLPTYRHRGDHDWISLRIANNLPPSISAIVFANFNKHDKFEPNVFWNAWMPILQQVPASILWLLEPSSSKRLNGSDMSSRIQSLIRTYAEASGISQNRIRFAPRVDKSRHLERMGAADLFLDTLLYGAHSTATDALKGGLPVLTLEGDSFASRVGTSLVSYLNFDVAMLYVTYSMKEYVDVAVRYARDDKGRKWEDDSVISSRFRSSIRQRDPETEGDLFDGEGFTRDLERLSKVLWEVYSVTDGKTMHVAVV